jgi:hypothetical protein
MNNLIQINLFHRYYCVRQGYLMRLWKGTVMVLKRGHGGSENGRFGLDGIRNHLMRKLNYHDIEICISRGKTDVGIRIIPNGVPKLIDGV